VNLAAGTYIIIANSATITPVTGAYTLTTSFATSPPPVSQSPSGVWDGPAVTPGAPDVSTSFETNTVTNGGLGPFSIGTSPFGATFDAGIANSRGIPGFYITGLNAWHILAGFPATVTFETPPRTLSFWVITQNLAVVSTIEIRDVTGNLILPVITPTTTYTQIFVNRTATDTAIGSMVVTSPTGGDVIIDDLTFGYVSTTDDIGCLVAETLKFVCILTDVTTSDLLAGAQGTVQVTGTQVTGSGTLVAAPGTTLADGSTVSNLTITGTVSEGNTLNLTIAAAGVSTSVSMTFDAPLYNRTSALATVAGVYSGFEIFGDPASFVVDAMGGITSQSGSGCVGSGQINVIDAGFNAYDVSLTLDVATCGAVSGLYDGLGLTDDDMAINDNNAFTFAVFTTDSVIVGSPNKP